MKKLSTIVLAVLLMTACTKAVEQAVPQSKLQTGEHEATFVIKDHKVTMDNIHGYSKMVMDNLGTATRAAREISGVKVILRQDIQPAESNAGAGEGVIIPFSDRGDLSDTMMYAVNFKNNQGFMLLSTDSRVPVLALIDEGEFTEVGDNPGFRMFLDMTEPYIQQTIVEQQHIIDSIEATIPPGPRPRIIGGNGGGGTGGGSDNPDVIDPIGEPAKETYMGTDTYLVSEIVPFVLPLIKTKWGQGEPFNDKFDLCPPPHSQRDVAGCVTIAVAQLFAYYQWPERTIGFDQHWLDWKSILTRTYSDRGRNEVSILVKDIANEMDAEASCNSGNHSTSVSSQTKIPKLCHYGYTTVGPWKYDTRKVINSLGSAKPVLIRATIEENGDGGHCWILDGFDQQIEQYVTRETWYSSKKGMFYKIVNRTSVGTDKFFIHCNWGWGGANDGYYNNEIWDTKKPFKYDSSGGASYSNSDSHYQYGIKMFLNLRPTYFN